MNYHQRSSQSSLLGSVLIGSYVSRSSMLHRTPLWTKSLLCAAILIALALTGWKVALSALALTIMIAWWGAKIPIRTLWDTLYTLRWLIFLLGIYYILWGTWQNAIDVICTIVSAIFLSRILLSTTPLPILLDGVVWLLKPLTYLGLPSERLALMLALMLRSIPAIMDRWGLLHLAAQARGLPTRSTWRLVTPLVIHTVNYAQNTGDALAARGLDNESDKG